ncbi:tetratricopeptide repeat protein, partial [Nitrospina gracilis]|uniref:tetratricopeptide repeat protein n=1 Tax=Nitrospina gracilis TaxID=35801 RepID=UPI001C9DE768
MFLAVFFLCLVLSPGSGLTQEKSGLDPGSSLFYQGETLFHKGDFLGAKAVFEDFLDLYPNESRRSKAFFRLGQIEIKNRFYSSGLKYFE